MFVMAGEDLGQGAHAVAAKDDSGASAPSSGFVLRVVAAASMIRPGSLTVGCRSAGPRPGVACRPVLRGPTFDPWVASGRRDAGLGERKDARGLFRAEMCRSGDGVRPAMVWPDLGGEDVERKAP